MKIITVLIKSVTASLFICVITAQNSYADFNPGQPRPLPHEAFVPGQVLVKFKKSTPPGLINNLHAAVKATVVTEFSFAKLQLVRLKPGKSVTLAVQEYSRNPNVIYAEPDYIYSIDSITPNDTDYSKLWGLHNTGQTVNGGVGTNDADIDAPQAWETTTGSDSVVVGILDSGVAWNHEDLAGNLWSNSDETANGSDSDGNGKVDDIRGWDFVDNDNDPYDLHSHGTHVAGTVAAVGNNSTGVVGVSWNARIMPLRVLDSTGSGSTSNIIFGIQYAIQNGAHIINASLGGEDFSQSFKDAIEAAGNAGILFVAAAGNDGKDNDGGTHNYPSDYTLDNILSVAATDQNDGLASFSNYGTISVDVGAPGVNTYSTLHGLNIAWNDTFEDGDISDWTTGGVGTTWSVTTVGLNSSYGLTDSAVGDYQSNSNNWARSPAFNLSGLSGCKLDYALVSLLEPGFDFLYVEVSSNGTNFSTVQILSFYDDQFWYLVSVPLSNFDGLSTVFVRFRMTSDPIIVSDGVYIDNVSVSCADPTNISSYGFKNGTSMATPHVSGLAALILSKNNTLSVTELKTLIMDHGDPLSALSGKINTGKRINTSTSISNTTPPTPTADPQYIETGLGHTCFKNSANKVVCWGN